MVITLLILICASLVVAMPKRRSIRIIVAAILSILIAIILLLVHGINRENDRATRDTIHELASYLREGNTGVVVRTILQSDDILPTNSFSGMTFEKIMIMSQSTNTQNNPSFDAVLVVLGNEPLDDDTPTVDTIARVNTALAFLKVNPATLLIFTGGPTAGTNTEARMMAELAVAEGVSTNSIRLEEEALSTQQNARLTANIIRQVSPKRIFIVSKMSHLDWAMPIFREIDVFARAEPLACQVSRADSIAQMEQYLKTHDSPRVSQRLQQLQDGVKGTD